MGRIYSGRKECASESSDLVRVEYRRVVPNTVKSYRTPSICIEYRRGKAHGS